MSTSPLNQVPENSYDSTGVSIVVSDRSATDPRPGAFFDPDFAAVSPIHFQKLDGSKVIGVFSERWSNGVRPVDSQDPNLFATRTVDTEPSWAIFDGATGYHYPIPGQQGFNPPTRIKYDTRIATGACSRINSYLYVLQRLTYGGYAFSVVSLYHINPVSWQVNLLAEEKIPSAVIGGKQVVFDRGIHYGDTFLTFFGADTDGVLYVARKNWGYVGRNTGLYQTAANIQYQTAKGWTEDPLGMVSIKDSGGMPLTSVGPVDLADFRGKVWISTVKNDGGNMSAQVYASRGLYESWAPENDPYALGTLGSTYMGGTVYFQPTLRAHPAAVATGTITGIPLVYATKVISGGNQAIELTWDLWPIPVSG